MKHLAAGFLLLAPGRRVLLLRRSSEVKHPGQWCFPGGRAEPGEDAWAAALRETEEEAGWTPESHGGARARASWQTGTERRPFTTFVLEVPRVFEPTLDFESDAWGWLTPEDALDELPLHKGVRVGLERLASLESR